MSTIAGVAWGERYKFTSTTDPVSYQSDWTWNQLNSVPYVKLWTTAVDATMGTVQTQTMSQQDAGGYWGIYSWRHTSAEGSACGGAVMPCNYNWPFQSINYNLDVPTGTTSITRLAWGTNFGFLGQSAYYVQGSEYWGGPLPDATAPGWPKKSYSVYVVLGTHTSDPVGAQVAEVEAVQSLVLAATVGSVATSGPAGVNRADTVTYAPAGYDHVYGTLAFVASGNALDATISVGAGRTLRHPIVVVRNFASTSYPSVRWDGVEQTIDTDYFPSLRAGAQELWITLNADVGAGSHQLEIAP